jgi:hypothetical protein
LYQGYLCSFVHQYTIEWRSCQCNDGKTGKADDTPEDYAKKEGCLFLAVFSMRNRTIVCNSVQIIVKSTRRRVYRERPHSVSTDSALVYPIHKNIRNDKEKSVASFLFAMRRP